MEKCASVKHGLAEGIPDKYAMGQLGHATPNMLLNVYQHLRKEKEDETAQKLNDFVDGRFWILA